MKYCTECGKELEKDAKVCGNCGKRIKVDESVPAQEMTTQNATINISQSNNTQAKQSNGLAIAGFVVSLVSMILCCGSFSWLGLIFSIIGLSESKKKNGAGKGLAIAGIVISSISLALLIIFWITGVVGTIMEDVGESVGTSL